MKTVVVVEDGLVFFRGEGYIHIRQNTLWKRIPFSGWYPLKTITGMAVMQLVEDGKLEFCTDINEQLLFFCTQSEDVIESILKNRVWLRYDSFVSYYL